LRNARVFEFAGIVGLAKLREFTRAKVRIIRNGEVAKTEKGEDDIKELVMRGSSGCAYLTDDDTLGVLNTLGTMTISCATEVSIGANGVRLFTNNSVARNSIALKNDIQFGATPTFGSFIDNIQSFDVKEKDNKNDNENENETTNKHLRTESEMIRTPLETIDTSDDSDDDDGDDDNDEKKQPETKLTSKQEQEVYHEHHSRHSILETESFKYRLNHRDSIVSDNLSDAGSNDEKDDEDNIEQVSYSLILTNRVSSNTISDLNVSTVVNGKSLDKLEIHFASIQERNLWKTLIDDWTSKALSSDASTMLECQTAMGCTRELEKRVSVLDDVKGDYGLREKYNTLLQRCEEWLFHSQIQRLHASDFEHSSSSNNGLNDYDLIKTKEEEYARKDFKRRVMMEQAKRDEWEQSLAKRGNLCSRLFFDCLTSSYQHKLEPPIRNGVVVAFHTFQYIYIVICSLWLAVFATCNGSAKSAQWIQGNLCIVFVSALIIRPISLLGVNVLMPAFCIKWGRCCCAGGGEDGTKKSGTNGPSLSSKQSTVFNKKKKHVRGTSTTMHGKGLFHAKSVGTDGEMMNFHDIMQSDGEKSDVSVAIASDVDVDNGEVVTVGREIEMTEL